MTEPTRTRRGALRRRRAALIVGLAGATGGGLLLTAAAAQAVTGSQPGKLILHPATGPASSKPTWSTTDGCQAGFQRSAVLYELNTNGSIGSSISPTVASPASAFHGTLLGSVSQLLSLGTDVKAGGTSQWVVGCFSGPGGTGHVQYTQSTRVTLSADGRTYTSPRGSAAGGVSSSVPWLLIVLPIGAGAAALGGWQLVRWRRRGADGALITQWQESATQARR